MFEYCQSGMHNTFSLFIFLTAGAGVVSLVAFAFFIPFFDTCTVVHVLGALSCFVELQQFVVCLLLAVLTDRLVTCTDLRESLHTCTVYLRIVTSCCVRISCTRCSMYAIVHVRVQYWPVVCVTDRTRLAVAELRLHVPYIDSRC